MNLLDINSKTEENQNVRILNMLKENGVKLLNVAFQLTNKENKFKGDFSKQDLVLLENCISDLYSAEDPPLTHVFIPLGFYLGETLVKNIPNAKWDVEGVDEGDLFSIKVLIPTINDFKKLLPFHEVRNLWLYRKESLSDIYGKYQNIIITS